MRRLHISSIYLEDIYAIKGNDYYLDGSGFRYSDLWKWKKKALDIQKRRWCNNKKANSKLVFLPQAFGPFNEKYSQNELRQINEVADLIMPREEVSYNYLKSSGIVDMNKVRLHTDFTSLVHGEMPSGYEHLKGWSDFTPLYWSCFKVTVAASVVPVILKYGIINSITTNYFITFFVIGSISVLSTCVAIWYLGLDKTTRTKLLSFIKKKLRVRAWHD